jgi:disease resistance protein RPM1
MEALSKNNSRILFLSKITPEKENGADFEEVSGNMLNMCGGMPLAIIVASGLLARKSEELAELKIIMKSSHSSLEQYSTSEGMTKILRMSYADLSLPLRSCFLYLSIFSEKYTITKDRLIRLWGAEGFIPRKDEEYLWATGEMFFNELISRRLIQPVFDYDVDDKAVGCTIHGVILDFIRSLSREENFAMTAADFKSGPFPCDTIRRFSVYSSDEDEALTSSTSSKHLSSMRSLIVFGVFQSVSDDDEEMYDDPPLSVSEGDEEMSDDLSVYEDDDPPAVRVTMINLPAFKLLQVLDLEDTCNLKKHHLEGLGGLVLLRYLGLGGTGIDEIPKDIGELDQLETLYLRLNGLITFPASIVKLQKLKHLLLQVDGTEIWEMPELEVASDIRVENSSSLVKVIELLRKSERLRILGLTLKTSIPKETDLVPFLEEVVKSKLQSLSLCWDYRRDEAILVDSWEKVTAPLANKFEPRRFELKISISPLKQVPPNIGSLASLTHLHVRFVILKARDFLVLKDLTNLVLLNLLARDCDITGRFIIHKGIFPCLKVFSFTIEESWIGLEFEEEAMPQLQRLGRGFRVSERGNQAYQDLGIYLAMGRSGGFASVDADIQDIGIEHLTCLTQVHINLNCQDATVSEVAAAEASIRGKVSDIATKPTLKLSRQNEYIMRKNKQGQHIQVTTHIKNQVCEMYDKRKLQFVAPAKVSEKHLSTVFEDKLEDQGKHFFAPAEVSEPSRCKSAPSSIFLTRCSTIYSFIDLRGSYSRSYSTNL